MQNSNHPKKALIVGISGQDGAYLASLLLQKGYQVFGTSRDAELSRFGALKLQGIYEKVKLLSMSLVDFRSVMQVLLDIKPDEIYNLAGQSSVGLSFQQPVETFESIVNGTLNILEIIRFNKLEIKFYNASSSECFGDTKGELADENTPFRPRSPYAVAKSAAFWQVANYREAYHIFACSGILFNHESPLRPNRFVTKKIIANVCEIAQGKRDKLILGNIKIRRDWGWAPEYVEAMYLMLQQEKPEDYVIATGKSISLEEFINKSFQYFNLNYLDYLETDPTLMRPTDIDFNGGNANKAYQKMGWKPTIFADEIVKRMIAYELSQS